MRFDCNARIIILVAELYAVDVWLLLSKYIIYPTATMQYAMITISDKRVETDDVSYP
jgi:hypothetical protein